VPNIIQFRLYWTKLFTETKQFHFLWFTVYMQRNVHWYTG